MNFGNLRKLATSKLLAMQTNQSIFANYCFLNKSKKFGNNSESNGFRYLLLNFSIFHFAFPIIGFCAIRSNFNGLICSNVIILIGTFANFMIRICCRYRAHKIFNFSIASSVSGIFFMKFFKILDA